MFVPLLPPSRKCASFPLSLLHTWLCRMISAAVDVVPPFCTPSSMIVGQIFSRYEMLEDVALKMYVLRSIDHPPVLH